MGLLVYMIITNTHTEMNFDVCRKRTQKKINFFNSFPVSRHKKSITTSPIKAIIWNTYLYFTPG